MVLSKARNENVDSKLLSQKTIYSLVGGGLILSFLILYLSGVLSGPSFNNIPKEGINQSGGQSPSVNLNNLEMINDLESKVKADPSDHQSLIELAHLRMDSGFFEQAIQNYKEYLKHHPEVADVIVDMAVCYFNLSEYDTALHYMKEALKIEPRHQIAHLNIGVVNLNMGNVAESKEWFKKAVELNPNTDAGKKAQQLLISH
jgi:tetratricopeptide (TPR) repeat protein